MRLEGGEGEGQARVVGEMDFYFDGTQHGWEDGCARDAVHP